MKGLYFSSLLFLFVFLPIVLAVYYIIPRKLRNGFLLAANLVFYGWGEPVFILIMLVSIVSNYIFGLLIEKCRGNIKCKRVLLILSLVISLGLLGVFKYTGFVSDILRSVPPFAFMPKIRLPLPIGISFYTFQTISYVIDVYRGDTKAQRSLVSFGTYVSFFPQLIAGPIVRYADIAKMLDSRRETISQFAKGIKLFTIGLGKKVLIANQMGVLWNTLRAMTDAGGVLSAWIGIISFAFQIYFDFSGYSDMARGLGNMFGFEFMKNFNYPYISRCITEFWRRWHISLSTWFRDYLYIPLGGNRKGISRTIFNLLVVWFLTGLWHGANFNFILWGLYYFVILILEKYVFGKYIERLPGALRHIYALVLILIGWVIFSFEDMGLLIGYLSNMFSLGGGIISMDAAAVIISYLPLIIVSAIASLPLLKNVYYRCYDKKYARILEMVSVMLILLLCTASLVNQGYNPFLYFRF